LLGALAARLVRADAALAAFVNAWVRGSAFGRVLTSGLATRLAGVEVALMCALAVTGRRGSAVRMLAAVALVYVASELLGMAWPRRRPFAGLKDVEGLVPHTALRSFPSRHVASGLAMAMIGGRAHPLLGSAMALVAWLLGLSRVAAGLHYPSDVLSGALLGKLVGRLLQE
jgi:membrane-associated phospholipid phosphatase